MWKYANRKSKFVIKADGRPLPIYRQGMFLRPKQSGPSTVSELKNKLADGYIFSTQGILQLDKKLDTEWQDRILGLYDQVSAVLKEACTGYDGFAIYCSLLGAVREQGFFIGHDFDFDMAYVSEHPGGGAAAEGKYEAHRVHLRSLTAASTWTAGVTALHIHHLEDPKTPGVDLFHLFFG